MEPVRVEKMRVSNEETEGMVAVLYMTGERDNHYLGTKLLKSIDNALDELETDSEVCAIVLTGEGRVFCAGADIEEMLPLTEETTADFGSLGSNLNLRIEKFPKPIVAAINGMALGGGNEIAMACHYRIAVKRARFGQPECTLGITPGAGATIRLAKLVGREDAGRLLFTGTLINAARALNIGLIDRTTEMDLLLEEAAVKALELSASA